MGMVTYHRKITWFILISIFSIMLSSCAGRTHEITASDQDSTADEANTPPEGDVFQGSCDVSAELGYCYDYSGSGWTREMAELDCSLFEDSFFLEDRCPQESRLAYCEFYMQGKSELVIVRHYYQPMDISQAEMSCPGTFFPLEQ